MAAPEKNEVTENDLFSALGISAGGSSTSSKPKPSKPLSDTPKAGNKNSQKKSSGDLSEDALLDIFGSGSSSKKPSSNSSSKPAKSGSSPSSSKRSSEAVRKQVSQAQRRKVDPKRDAERAAQLREKAIRSRQWKEELQRKRREQAMMGSDGAKSVSIPDQAAEKGQKDEIITVEAVESKKALLEDTETRETREGFGGSREKQSEIREGSTRESREKQPTSQPSEVRDAAIRSRFSSHPAQNYTPAPNPWMMQPQQTAWPQRASQAQQETPTQQVTPVQQVFQFQDEAQLQQRAMRNEAGSSQSARREARAQQISQAMQSKSQYASDQPEIKMPERSQGSDSHNPRGGAFSTSEDAKQSQGSAQMSQGSVQASQDPVHASQGSVQESHDSIPASQFSNAYVQRPSMPPEFMQPPMQNPDPRMQFYPDIQRQGASGQFSDPNYQQILMQQYCDPAVDYNDDRSGEPETGGTSPLGIVLIVLAVLCVLVAASLLTGLWDISNLR